VDARHLRRVLARIAILQIDSVNVFCRTHYMPLFSRLGPYPREALDKLTAHTAGPVRRELFEYWAHEASLVPVELQPLLRWRMQRANADAWGGMRRIARDNPNLVDEVMALVGERGPIRAGETGAARPARRPGEMWNWHDGKVALEYLFWAGRVTAARRINFERLYDLPERVLPPEVLAMSTPTVEAAQRELVRIAARADGGAAERVLHGEPHPGNLLNTASGLRFIDLETCCRGPVEFDLAHVPENVAEYYADVDHELLRECRGLVLAMVAAWRWDPGDQFPNGRRAARELVSALRDGPPWPTLDEVWARIH